MRIVICIPAQDQVHTTFMNDLVQLIMYTHNNTTRIVEIVQMNGCYLDLLRNQMIQSALERKPDNILMLDSDMRFPKETAARLIIANKEIIGCNYTRRRAPFTPIGMTGDGNSRIDPIASKGITQVAIIPTGVMMLRPSVFDRIQYPWFECHWRREGHNGKPENRLIGEDVYFCAKANDAGIGVYCDHDLSRDIGHSGQMDYTIPMICGG